MSKEALISIVIPVYNAERYLAECLDSVLGQTYENLEVILINDGSRDASGEICRQYREKDDRIILIQQENAGVSTARNRGICLASGAYVMFVDADDLIAPGICETACRHMETCDILMFHFTTFRQLGELKAVLSSEEQPTYQHRFSGEDCLRSLFGSVKSVPAEISLPSMWAKLYRRSFLNQYRVLCPQGVINGEDMLFNAQVYMREPRICYLPETGYFYRYDPLSAVHKYSPRTLENEERFYRELEHILIPKQLWNEYREDIDYQKVDGLLRVFSSDIFHKDNPKTELEKKSTFFELVGQKEYQRLMAEQKMKFPVQIRCVLFLARKKLYTPLKEIYQLWNLIKLIP